MSNLATAGLAIEVQPKDRAAPQKPAQTKNIYYLKNHKIWQNLVNL